MIKESEFFFCIQSGVNGDLLERNLENRKRLKVFYGICTKIAEFQYYLLISEPPYGDSHFSLHTYPNQVR